MHFRSTFRISSAVLFLSCGVSFFLFRLVWHREFSQPSSCTYVGPDIVLCYTWYVRVLRSMCIYICMQSAAAAILVLLKQQCCCLLLLLAIVCRMAKIVAGSLTLIAEFYFKMHTQLIFHVPLGSTVALTASICLHPWKSPVAFTTSLNI